MSNQDEQESPMKNPLERDSNNSIGEGSINHSKLLKQMEKLGNLNHSDLYKEIQEAKPVHNVHNESIKSKPSVKSKAASGKVE